MEWAQVASLFCHVGVLCFCWMHLLPQTYRIVAIYLQYLHLGKSTKLIWSGFFSRNLHNPLLIFTYLLMLREQSFIHSFFNQVGLGNKLYCIWQPCVLCMFVWPEPYASCRAENPTHCVTNETLGLCASIYFSFSMASEEGKVREISQNECHKELFLICSYLHKNKYRELCL